MLTPLISSPWESLGAHRLYDSCPTNFQGLRIQIIVVIYHLLNVSWDQSRCNLILCLSTIRSLVFRCILSFMSNRLVFRPTFYIITGRFWKSNGLVNFAFQILLKLKFTNNTDLCRFVAQKTKEKSCCKILCSILV